MTVSDPGPDPRTVAEDDEDAVTNWGESADKPAEGANDVSPEQPGSPEG